MAKETMENLIKRVVAEICEKNKGLHIDSPFSIVVYDPRRPRADGIMSTRESLAKSVQALFVALQREPQSNGEILRYRPVRRVVYEVLPNK